jgi:hypothetical protein
METGLLGKAGPEQRPQPGSRMQSLWVHPGPAALAPGFPHSPTVLCRWKHTTCTLPSDNPQRRCLRLLLELPSSTSTGSCLASREERSKGFAQHLGLEPWVWSLVESKATGRNQEGLGFEFDKTPRGLWLSQLFSLGNSGTCREDSDLMDLASASPSLQSSKFWSNH